MTEAQKQLPFKEIHPRRAVNSWEKQKPAENNPEYAASKSWKSLVPYEFPYKPTIGYEIEMEGGIAKDSFTKRPWPWYPGEDNSLRNNGIEWQSFVLKSPEEVGIALASLKDCLDAHFPQRKFTWRTASQIHVSMADMTLSNVVGLLLVYLTLERFLFEVYAPKRKDSVFCVPLTNADLFTSSLSRCIKNASNPAYTSWPSDLLNVWSKATKYGAINFLRLDDLGTVEFRHLHGTDDWELIRDWTSAVTGIISYAKTTPLEVIMKQIMELNTNSEYVKYIQGIFLGHTKTLVDHFKKLEEYLSPNVAYAKALIAYASGESANLLKVSKKGAVSQYLTTILKKKKNRIRRLFDV